MVDEESGYTQSGGRKEKTEAETGGLRGERFGWE